MCDTNIVAAKFFGRDKLAQAAISPQLQTLVYRTITNILYTRCVGGWDTVTMEWFQDNVTAADVVKASGSGTETLAAVQKVLKWAGCPELP